MARLEDIVVAHDSVLEPEAADGLRREGRIMLASAAAEGLISRDADGALAALDAGGFDDAATRREAEQQQIARVSQIIDYGGT